MKPAPVDLPTIWRGCTWEAVILKWKDRNGHPIPLGDWTPVATTAQFSLNARKTPDQTNHPGETTMSLTKEQTTALKLGVHQWNWLWVNGDGTIPPPFLAGIVEVKNPVLSAS
jgi:hypothetical protein